MMKSRYWSVRVFAAFVPCIVHCVSYAPYSGKNNSSQSGSTSDVGSASIGRLDVPLHATAVLSPRPTRNSRSRRIRNTIPKSDNTADSQNFFPSFQPIMEGPSRSLPYSETPFKPTFKSPNYRELPLKGANEHILGSGNFGVVKGGTFFADERDNDDDFTSTGEDAESFTYIGSTDGRIYKKNPAPAFRNGGDFFAHFKDFADITGPSKAYSQYYVVYVNKNATNENASFSYAFKRPKNIMEQLEMLDEESRAGESAGKRFKFKSKLAVYQNLDKQKKKSMKSKLFESPKEVYEPLLALS